ncbi:MAG: MarR family transcriptional regulator [Clostridiaceae bacterium]
MNQKEQLINELLVTIFNDIVQIEQRTLKAGALNDLSVTEIHTIEAIGMYTPRNMSEVAADLKITLGTLTTAINKLIKKGYVGRNRIEEDRRVVQVQLTKKGKLAYRLHDKFHSDMTRNIVEELNSEEEEILIKSLGKISEFFKEKNSLLT